MMPLTVASGFLLLTEGMEAYARRLQLLQEAKHQINIQSYIFEDGYSTRRFILALIAAAERGVHIRLLFDDLSIGQQQSGLEKLATHPNIEIKLFNPITKGRRWTISRLFMLMLQWPKLHRRMHNKLWVIDERIAIWGGRNLSDDYFYSATHPLFIDMDVLAVDGHVPSELHKSFSHYWKHPLSVDLNQLTQRRLSDCAWKILLKKLQAQKKEQACMVSEYDRAEKLMKEETPEILRRRLIFANARVFWDDPQKAQAMNRPDIRLTLSAALSAELASLTQELQMVVGYLVPVDIDGLDVFTLLARRIQVTCLTNALEATDVPLVHGGYSLWRIPLLKAGAKLYEFRHRPWPRTRLKGRLHGRTRLKLSLHRFNALHAKTFVMDQDRIMVGSLNVDPRSVWWNCELAVVIESPQLNQAVRRLNASIMHPQYSYEVTLEHNRLQWQSDNGYGGRITVYQEPGNIWRKFQAFVAKSLHLQKLL